MINDNHIVNDYTRYSSIDGVKVSPNFMFGQLVVPTVSQKYQLRPFLNIVGRKSESSTADFQVASPYNLTSREHLLIEIRKSDMFGFIHVLSLYSAKVSPIIIDGTEIVYGDQIILQHGNTITLPDVEIIFEIPNAYQDI